MVSSSFESDKQMMNLPPTWFESRITHDQIRSCFSAGKAEIRIASGFFTIRGWGLIRNTTGGKRVYLLVGIDEPGEERARAVLVKEILHDLATGRDRDRRQSVQDLIEKMESGLLRMVDARATSHHGKLYIVDRSIAIVASANTTGRGFLEQKEAGGLYGPSLIERFIEQYGNQNITPALIEQLHHFIQMMVANYVCKFDEYFAIAKDITQELLEALKRWLQLASPWDIYLKTILALEEVPDVKSSYTKTPVSYQQDMIAQTLRPIRQHSGSMLVASTGLGKTVVGVHIAIHLKAEDLIDKVIVICPNAVQSIWKREMCAASIYSEFFNLEILDKKDSKKAHALEDWAEIERNINNSRWLLIFDESHKLRKRYPNNFKNKRYREEDKKERKAFTRIKKLVESGNVKVLLLTGSPYATEIDNINTQLLLLPHTNLSHALLPEFVDGCSWRISEIDEFINDFPVGSQLTTPHVARYYGKTDSEGVHIDFNGTKKYVPELILHSIYVPLPLENEIAQVINEGYFHLSTPHPIYRRNIETQVKVSWSSSLAALQNTLERTIDTPGGEKQFPFAKNQTSEFALSKSERQTALLPIINQLSQLNYDKDGKLQTLIILLNKHIEREKVIIFCERLITAFYLEQALNNLMPDLRIFSTVIKNHQGVVDYDNEYIQKDSKLIETAIEKFAPIANDAVERYQETYNIFIATDAYGIGVNMQDASVVFNYDIAWTPIEPIQRAGRILRLWDSPRQVQVYTFIPTVTTSIDLKPFDNSAITTLEEHIKRRWADISAETAGEQYTPDDVIGLIAEIIADKIEDSDRLLKIYDCTCGGGNLLFGVEDRINAKVNRLTQTFGQDWNDALYALAKIESRFRIDSKIEHGNTLTDDKFYNDEFDVVIANPPYGVDWKGFKKDITNDKTQRFKYHPSISDGQLLFMQHLISKLNANGMGVVVHNGSTLFSGDAGSAESNIRKWLLNSDIVEAVIQLPTDEFFNTGIYTYLWVLNRNKSSERLDRVMLINASEKFKPLKKSKGSKRKEIDEVSRLEVVETLARFVDNDYARVFDKEFFYFNKQAIALTNVDEQGKTFASRLKEGKTSLKLSPLKLENGERTLTEFAIAHYDSKKFSSLAEAFEQDIKPFVDSLDYKEQQLVVTTDKAMYWFDADKKTLIEEVIGKRQELGCGKMVVKAALKKGTKTQPERIEITVELTPDYQKDYEIIPFHRDETANKTAIAAFMAKYITKPFEYLENVVGVEINFNKVFYKPEKLRNVEEILGEIAALDRKLRKLEELIIDS